MQSKADRPLPPLAAVPRNTGDGPRPVYYTVKRSGRTRLTVRITDQGEVLVTAPRWVGNSQIDAFVQEKREWIFAHYDAWRAQRCALGDASTMFAEGGTVPFRGASVALRLGAQQTGLSESGVLSLALPADSGQREVAHAVFEFFYRTAGAVIGSRVAALSSRFTNSATRLALSNARRQWGSCTSQGHVYLSWRLIFFSDDVIDYVIAHEFAHRVQMNHSRAFWAEVEKILPTYRQGRAKLKSVRMAGLPL